MFGLGSDRKILGIYFQRRLFLAGAHAARPRHPCGLRAAEVRDRKIVGTRTAGVARDGNDGLAMVRAVVERASGPSSGAPDRGACVGGDRKRGWAPWH